MTKKTPWYKTDKFTITLAVVACIVTYVAIFLVTDFWTALRLVTVTTVFSLAVGVLLAYLGHRIAKDDKEYETVKEDPFPGILYQVHKTTGKRRWTTKRGPKPDINMDWVMGKTDEL